MKRFVAKLAASTSPKIGVMLLQADESLEGDLRSALPPEIECHITRMKSASEVSISSLKAIENQILSAGKVLPENAQFEAVAFACTSASVEIGSSQIASHVRDVCETQFVTNPFDALLAALKKHKLSRIALLSPYVESVNLLFIDALANAGVQVSSFGSFEIATEAKVVRISEASLFEAGQALMKESDAEATFISCTNLRCFGMIEKLENTLDGEMVLSSNQVLAWHLGELAGFKAKIPGKLGA